MSQDLTTILSGDFINPAELLVRIEQQLSPLAFRTIQPIYRVEFDDEREVFDETDSDDVSGFEMIDGIKKQIDHWQGNAITFQGDDFSFYLLIGATNSKFINCYVDITERTLRKLFDQDKIAQYYAILGIIGTCCQASGGYGAIELPFSPIAPDQVINAIWENPDNPDGPASIGLIPEQTLNQAALDRVTKSPFTLTDRMAGFWILAEKEYLSFFKKRSSRLAIEQNVRLSDSLENYNAALIALQQRGYNVWLNPRHNELALGEWCANKKNAELKASDPLKLLGLMALWEQRESEKVISIHAD
ncbi:MAG TPA: hypothetical protein DCM38_12545 [Gammaproteobacteria bacterium]|nr:hypothetical protein [Gammaproteobacteria bacterium]